MDIMANIWYALNVFQEELMLQDCINSIRQSTPWAKIVAVDGSYLPFYQAARLLAASHFSGRHDAVAEEILRYASGPSTDKTLEILRDMKVDRIIEASKGMPWPREHFKRSQYLQVGEPGDWIFVLDADERINGAGPTPEVLEGLGNTDACIMLRRDDDPPMAPYPVLRVHKVTGEYFRYRKAHHHLWRGNRIVKKPDLENIIVPNLTVEHYWCHRARITPHRHSAKGAYYVRLLDQIEASARTLQGF